MMTGVAGMGALYLLVFALAEAWARSGRPPREWPRKAVHIGCGLLSLMLPRFVSSPWVVAGMAAAFAGFCLVGGRRGYLRCIGSDRPSVGGELYPIAIFLVFVMAGGRTWLYVASIVTMALADAGATLIGMPYGNNRYKVADESRSLEGSAVFLALAFICMFLPMWRLGGFGAARSTLAAGLGAVLATAIESVSLRGFDNLLVPVGVCAALPWLTSLWPR